MADALALGASRETCGGSNPLAPKEFGLPNPDTQYYY